MRHVLKTDTDTPAEAAVAGHSAEAREPFDGSLGSTATHLDHDRLLYMSDLVAELQTMADNMKLGILARILAVAHAESERLLGELAAAKTQRRA